MDPAMQAPLRIAMVAGEASGDMLAALLIGGLQADWPGIELCGIGGPEMARRGVTPWWPSERQAGHGYSMEMLGRLRRRDDRDDSLRRGVRWRCGGWQVVGVGHLSAPGVWGAWHLRDCTDAKASTLLRHAAHPRRSCAGLAGANERAAATQARRRHRPPGLPAGCQASAQLAPAQPSVPSVPSVPKAMRLDLGRLPDDGQRHLR